MYKQVKTLIHLDLIRNFHQEIQPQIPSVWSVRIRVSQLLQGSTGKERNSIRTIRRTIVWKRQSFSMPSKVAHTNDIINFSILNSNYIATKNRREQ